IKNSSIFLACFSSVSVSKTGFIQRELKLALDRYAEMPEGKIYLIPLRLEECEIPELERDDLGIKLRDLHWLDYWEEDGFEILIRSLEFSQGRDPELKLRELRKLRDKIPQTQKFQQEINNIKIESVDVVTVNPQGQIIQKAPQQFKYFRENLAIGVDLELAQIPAGSFMMGTEDAEIERLCNTYHQEWFKNESPQHKVTVRAFWMSRYPITQAQWQVVAGWEKVEIDLDPDPSYFKEDYQGITRWNRPVECVSWNDAIEFCKRLSKKTKREYRLPSEAQWEYACRASTMTPFHFGETISTELANYDGKYNYDRGVKGKYREQTTPVGYFKVANNFGLYDMHGNVWEWCEDDWHDNYDNAPNDDTARIYAESSTKVIRGGSWLGSPTNCRSAYRNYYDPGNRDSNIGFRVVRLAPRSS
ncbi:MAG: SUMF1/EgtB/PvdO family nonheme iron enzyme, partial [Prochloraceae cyanobacterium]